MDIVNGIKKSTHRSKSTQCWCVLVGVAIFLLCTVSFKTIATDKTLSPESRSVCD